MSENTIHLKKTDIIQLRVEYSDKKGSKVRPVLIISRHQNELNYLEISSKAYLEDDDFAIKILKNDYHLKTDSYVKLWKIGTIDESLIPETTFVLDSLNLEDINKIIEKLNEYFSRDW